MAAPKARMTPRRSAERGHANHGWLDSYHSFSFAEYYDPEFEAFGALRVINEDFVESGQGFPTHPHRDFEIFSYLLSGSLSHKDSMGNVETLRRGHVQFTSAGTGIRHSEFNGDTTPDGAGVPVRFLQIWAKPNTLGLQPKYATGKFTDRQKLDRLCPIITPTGANGTIKIHADFRMFAAILTPGGAPVQHELQARAEGTAAAAGAARRCYIHVPLGNGAALRVEGARASDGSALPALTLAPGDGAFIENVATITLANEPLPAAAKAPRAGLARRGRELPHLPFVTGASAAPAAEGAGAAEAEVAADGSAGAAAPASGKAAAAPPASVEFVLFDMK